MTASLRLVAGRPCTLRGYPWVRLDDAEGRRLPLTYRRGQRSRPTPVLVTRSRPAQVTIGKYRCDVASSPRRTHVAEVGLRGVRAVWRVPTGGRLPLCARRDPSHTVLVWPFGGHAAPPGPYAVTPGSRLIRHPQAQWARAALSRSPRRSLVLVRPRGLVTARVEGRRLRVGVRLGGPAWLQGITDLDGDGIDEILLATSAGGCCAFAPTHTTTTVVRLVAGRLVALRGRLAFNRGSGEVFAGVRCGSGGFTQLVVGRAGQAPTAAASETAYRLSDDRLRVVMRTRHEGPAVSSWADAAIAATATRCPGLNAAGWAIR